MFVALTALYGAYISKDSPKRHWVRLILLSLAAAYTHYFALLAVFWVWIIFGLANIKSHSYLKKWLIAGVLVFIGYIPWLFVFFRQTQEVFADYWITDITLDTIKYYFWYIYSVYVPYLLKLIYALLLILFFYNMLKGKKTKKFQAGGYLLLPFIVIFCGVVISKMFRPVFMFRYILPGLGVMAVGEILILKDLQGKSAKGTFLKNATVLVLLAFIVSLNLLQSIRAERGYGASWKNITSMIENIKKDKNATFIYRENGQSLVRPFSVLWESDTHLCENADRSLYDQRLFGTKEYAGQNINGPVFIVVDMDKEIRAYEKCLGVIYTFNGNYKIYYDSKGYSE